MSLTAMTRNRFWSSMISAQVSERLTSPASVISLTWSRWPVRISCRARQASGIEVSVCRMWVMRGRPKMRSASPLAW